MAVRIPHPSCETELRQAFQQLRLSTDALTTGASGYVLVGAGVGNPPTWTTSLTVLTLLTVDNISINGAGITSDTGAISFGDENLSTTGTITGVNVTSGADPGHTHTGASLSAIDISDDTNLAVTSPIVLTDDTLSLNQAAVDHGSLAGLDDGDHDAVYYTETELDGGQLDNRYFTEAEHLATSAGVGDAGKPVKLDGAGQIDATMINSADVDHDATTNFVAAEHVSLPNTIANVLSDHDLAAHTILGLFDASSDVDHDATTNFVADEHVAHSGVTLTAGSGLAGGGDISANRTFDLDINSLSAASIEGGDFIPFWDITATATNKKITFANFEAALNHDSLTGFVASEHIDWTNATDAFFTTGGGEFELAADDVIGVEVDGASNPFSTAATSCWGSKFSRKANVGSSNLGSEYYALTSYATSEHTAAKIVSGADMVAAHFNNANTGSVENEGASNYNFSSWGFRSLVDDDGTYTASSTGYIKARNYGLQASALVDNTFVESGGSPPTQQCETIGANIFVRSRPTAASGNLTNVATGCKIEVLGNTVGTSTAKGLHVYGVSGCDTNWAVYDESGADWWVGTDSQKIRLGGGGDGSIYYDGTDFYFDAQEAGSGHVVLNSPKATTGDPSTVEGKFYWNAYDDVLKMYCDSGWRIVSDWSQSADRIHFWDQTDGKMGWLEVSTGLTLSGTTLTTNDSQIVHDSLSGFVGNEHIDHTGVTLTAGSGLAGGGDISSNRTFDLDINSLSAAAIAAGDFVPFWDITATATNKKITFSDLESTLNHDNLAGFVAAEHVSLPGTIANVLSDHTRANHIGLELPASTTATVYLSSNQTLNPSTYTLIPYDTEEFDLGSDYDNSNYHYDVPETGYYLAIAAGTFYNVADGKLVSVTITADSGATVLARNNIHTGYGGGYIRNNVSKILYLESGDEIEVYAMQTDSSSRTLIGVQDGTYFSITRIA